MTEDFDPIREVSANVDHLFRDYKVPVAMAPWLSLKQRFSVRSAVCGRVVARYPFGVFVDIGVGFPALLLIVRFKDAKRCYASVADFPPIGSLIEAKIWGWNERDRTIVLTQRDNEWSEAG
jgi:ribosomal protein S1